MGSELLQLPQYHKDKENGQGWGQGDPPWKMNKTRQTEISFQLLAEKWLVPDSLALKTNQPTARANGIFDSTPLRVFSPCLLLTSRSSWASCTGLEKSTDRVLNLKTSWEIPRNGEQSGKSFYFSEIKSITTYSRTTNSLRLDIWSLAWSNTIFRFSNFNSTLSCTAVNEITEAQPPSNIFPAQR